MNLNLSSISNREKRILLMLFGVLLLVASYLFVFRPQMESATEISDQNTTLDARLNQLLGMAAKKEYYQRKTEEMQQEIDSYCAKFPADIKEEDGIVLAQNIEKFSGVSIETVGTGVRQMISEDGTIDDSQDSGNQQTLSEQDNAATKEQVDQIEGNTEASTETGQTQSADALVEDTPTLYRTQDTLEYTGTYANLKKAVLYINSQTGRMTVDNITMTFDSATGGLTGTITVNIYSMSGIGTTYQEPDAGTSVYGKKNLFGTLEKQQNGKK